MLLGPSHQFTDYKNAIKGKVGGSDIPSGVAYGLQCFAFAIALFAWKTVVPGILGTSGDPKHLSIGPLTETGEVNIVHSASMLYKFGHIMVSMQLYRCTYYFAWLLAEGCCSMAGLGYKGTDKEGKDLGWGKICNVKPLNCEFAVNMKAVLDNWNCQTQTWLIIVCYERTKSVNMTMALSAIWHGQSSTSYTPKWCQNLDLTCVLPAQHRQALGVPTKTHLESSITYLTPILCMVDLSGPYLGFLMTFGTGAIVTEAARKVGKPQPHTSHTPATHQPHTSYTLTNAVQIVRAYVRALSLSLCVCMCVSFSVCVCACCVAANLTATVICSWHT